MHDFSIEELVKQDENLNQASFFNIEELVKKDSKSKFLNLASLRKASRRRAFLKRASPKKALLRSRTPLRRACKQGTARQNQIFAFCPNRGPPKSQSISERTDSKYLATNTKALSHVFFSPWRKKGGFPLNETEQGYSGTLEKPPQMDPGQSYVFKGTREIGGIPWLRENY